jgi:hypothetical protein
MRTLDGQLGLGAPIVATHQRLLCHSSAFPRTPAVRLWCGSRAGAAIAGWPKQTDQKKSLEPRVVVSES